ncbi:NMDA receptor-regulated protein 1-domain-containing protein [Russula earlei]|uniref:NMDA receptor-regulated protein 1-domain-containing protein n=1 Tax=Russula earlei TaxID=71964 RepID=A0ACC0UIE2_9AGAM|nr:NMDA receptor-regulated protein 1-domain-containing protein [Russula earlei]
MTPTPTKRALPSKESSLFRELLNLYETRQLKKGQKTADQILKKFPEHGETLCMKGLILTHMGKREEGLELVKKGVRLDLTSHIVWHVFGLIQKGEKNYEEALKSYIQALRFDKGVIARSPCAPSIWCERLDDDLLVCQITDAMSLNQENMNILRDAAHLQTQLRLYDGLVDTRFLLLKLRPNLRQNWIGLALAYHLNGNLVEARRVLEQYERSLKNVPEYDPEQSDLLLYHVRILEDMEEFTTALTLLDTKAKSRAIVDRVAQDSGAEAEQAWRTLIHCNPDNTGYYYSFFRSKNIELGAVTDPDRMSTLRLLQDLSLQNPHTNTPKRLELMVVSAEGFRPLANDYLWSGLQKGIPSLFVDMKSLYQDTRKRVIVEELVDGYRQSLEKNCLPDGAPNEIVAESDSDVPTTYLWTLYFLAQHFSHIGQHSRALSLLSSAITHTPTLPELHTLRGRILKRVGDFLGASVAVNEARLLDGQDRFLNTKSAKYKLRAGLIEEANDTFGLFTKKDAVSPGADLEEMQSLLYLTEEGDAHRRQGRLHYALKKYHAVRKIFEEFEDDQFDFHGYSLRKFTINIYLNLLSWEDRLWSHPAYIHCAISASQIYVELFDNPSRRKDVLSTGKELVFDNLDKTISRLSGMSAEEEKKAKKRAKKAQQKQEEQKKAAAAASAASAATTSTTNEDKGLDLTPQKDDDPDGIKLLTSPEPLDRAWKLLSPLLRLSISNLDLWFSVFDVAVRRGKYLQAIRALTRAKVLDANHPDLHVRLLHFRKLYESLPSSLPSPVAVVVSDALETLITREMTLETYNAQYLQQNHLNARAILGAAWGLQILGSPRDEIEGVVFGTLNPQVVLPLKTALDVLSFLKDISSPRANEFRLACEKIFDLSTVFKTPDQLAIMHLQRQGTLLNTPNVDD